VKKMTAFDKGFEQSLPKQTQDSPSGLGTEASQLFNNFNTIYRQNLPTDHAAISADGSIDFGQASSIYGSLNPAVEKDLDTSLKTALGNFNYEIAQLNQELTAYEQSSVQQAGDSTPPSTKGATASDSSSAGASPAVSST
jgi:hypothetical protein